MKKLSEYTFDDGTVDGPEYLTFIYGTDESGNETKKKQSKSQFHFSDWVKGILFFCFFFFWGFILFENERITQIPCGFANIKK